MLYNFRFGVQAHQQMPPTDAPMYTFVLVSFMTPASSFLPFIVCQILQPPPTSRQPPRLLPVLQPCRPSQRQQKIQLHHTSQTRQNMPLPPLVPRKGGTEWAEASLACSLSHTKTKPTPHVHQVIGVGLDGVSSAAWMRLPQPQPTLQQSRQSQRL